MPYDLSSVTLEFDGWNTWDAPRSCGGAEAITVEYMGTGSAPAFKRFASSCASATLNVPVMTALPPVIFCCTRGAEMMAPSKKIATDLPTFRAVISSKSRAHSLLNSCDTLGNAVF